MTGSREETVIDAVPRHSVASDGPRARIIGEEYINYLAAAGNAPSDLRDGDVYWRSTMRLLSGRRLLLFAFLFIPALFSSCSTGDKAGPSAPPSTQKVIIVYPGPLGLYDEIIAAFREGLARELPGKPIEVIARHGNNEPAQYSTLISTAVSDRPDIIAPIGTQLSKEAVKNAGHIPIVFLGVTDPLGDGVVKSLTAPELSTGVSDLIPVPKLLALIRQVTPSVRKIGFPYTPKDPPALFSVRELQRLGPPLGFVVDARPVSSRDELDSLVRDLARVNDALVIGADTGLFPAAEQIAKIAMQARKPFFAGDSGSVEKGAALGVTIDYHDVGRSGALLAARVLKGEKAGTIPVTLLTNGVVMVNEASLKKLRIRLTEDVRQQVKR
jgi:putative ABC transport system substrate-binding protein